METIESKQKITKQMIKTVLDKEQLSYWDVKTLFEYVDTALDKKEGASLNYFSSVSTAVQEDIEYAIVRTKNIAEVIVKLENSLLDQLNKSYESISARFDEYIRNVSKLSTKANEYKLSLPQVSLPYGWSDMLKMLEQLSEMPENKRKIFIELAEKFSAK